MVNSQLIFSKKKIFLSGNILGKPSNLITNNSKIYFTIRLSDSSNLIAITQHNLANNTSRVTEQNKTFFHKFKTKKNIQSSSRNILTNSVTFEKIPYIDSCANYLFDESFNYMTIDYSNNFTLYYNYGLAQIQHNSSNNYSKIIEDISIAGFLDFSNIFTDYNNLDISFLNLNDNRVSYKNINAVTNDNKEITITLNYPSPKPTNLGNNNYSNQIILRNSLSNVILFLDLDYIYYDSSTEIYYLYPFDYDKDIDITSDINLSILQLEEKSFNLENYFIGASKSFSIYDFRFIATEPLSTNTYYLHYNNKIIQYQIIETPKSISSEIRNLTNRNSNQKDLLLSRLGISNSSNITFPNYHNNNFGILTVTVKSLTRLFTGKLVQRYRLFMNLPDIEIISNIFTINYEILCNPFLCPLPAFPNRISQISTMGSSNSFRMQFSQKIKNAHKSKARKTLFISQ